MLLSRHDDAYDGKTMILLKIGGGWEAERHLGGFLNTRRRTELEQDCKIVHALILRVRSNEAYS